MQNTLRLTLSYIAIAIACVIILYPVLWIVGSSFNPGDSLSGSSIIPKDATLEHYKSLFNTAESDYLLWYWNTLKICIITMILAVAMISCMAYAFSRYRFVGRKNGLMTFLILSLNLMYFFF